MIIRKRSLPSGWYPDSPEAILQTIAEFKRNDQGRVQKGLAGIAPHAGWYFSGKMAYTVISSLKEESTCVVIGGHLGQADRIRLYSEDGFETPLGILTVNKSLREKIRIEFNPTITKDADNTVEVQLPFLKACFPKIQVLCLRCPPNGDSLKLGAFLSVLVKTELPSMIVLASTDLTHYGPNYGFIPKGTGQNALTWVREENDRTLLESAIRMDAEEILSQAAWNGSACSAGAAAAAAAFARRQGLTGRLLGYETSWEKHPSTSFVGYGGVIYA